MSDMAPGEPSMGERGDARPIDLAGTGRSGPTERFTRRAVGHRAAHLRSGRIEPEEWRRSIAALWSGWLTTSHRLPSDGRRR